MKSVTPSRIRGRLPAPPSKSMTVRALAAGLLSQGLSRIENVSFCEDGLAAASIVRELGATIERNENALVIHGTGRERLRPRTGRLECGESGLSMRMFAPVAALFPGKAVLVGSGSLQTRPMVFVV